MAERGQWQGVKRVLRFARPHWVLIALTLSNRGAAPKTVSLVWTVRGTLDETSMWEFARTQSQTAVAMTAAPGTCNSTTSCRV